METQIFEKTFDLLEMTKTNWSVEKKPLMSLDGLNTESFGIFRKDDNSWLGTVSKQYTPMQNSELAENIIDASLEVCKNFRGGMLNNGKKIYYQAELNSAKIANDTVERFLTILNSHDGSSSIGFGLTNKVVICQNTFHLALRDVNKFRHTQTASDRVKIAKEQIKFMLNQENILMDDFKRMADTKITESVVKKVVASIFDLKEEDFTKTSDEISTKKINELTAFKNIMDAEITSHGNSLWGLFNAVTWKTNHHDTKKKDALENVMIGSGYKRNLQAFNVIMESIPKTY